MLLALLLACAVGIGWHETRPAETRPGFCTADGFLMDDGTVLHRDNTQDCAWVDPDGQRVSLDHGKGHSTDTARNDANAAMELVSVRPTWRPASAPPMAALRAASMSPSRRGLVEVTRFWVAPGSIDTEATWMRSHPPNGFKIGTVGNGGGPGRAAIQSIKFDEIDANPGEKQHVYLIVSLAADGAAGTAIRVDAQVSSSPTHF